MKKLASIMIGLSLFSLNSSEYLIRLDDKHYKSNIAIKDYEDTAKSPVATESPYTEKETVLVDWKTSGDSQVVLDTSTGLEWLNIANTRDMSVAQVESLLDTTFSGWRLPTRAEVLAFMQINFPTRGFTDTPKNVLAGGTDAKTYGDKIGYTYNTERSYGMYRSNAGSNDIVMSGVRVGYYIYHLLPESSEDTYKHSTEGVFLVSEGGASFSSLENPAINIPVE